MGNISSILLGIAATILAISGLIISASIYSYVGILVDSYREQVKARARAEEEIRKYEEEISQMTGGRRPVVQSSDPSEDDTFIGFPEAGASDAVSRFQ